MQIEQTGVNEVTITLDTDLERKTIGKADTITATIKFTESTSFRSVECGKKHILAPTPE